MLFGAYFLAKLILLKTQKTVKLLFSIFSSPLSIRTHQEWHTVYLEYRISAGGLTVTWTFPASIYSLKVYKKIILLRFLHTPCSFLRILHIKGTLIKQFSALWPDVSISVEPLPLYPQWMLWPQAAPWLSPGTAGLSWPGNSGSTPSESPSLLWHCVQ